MLDMFDCIPEFRQIVNCTLLLLNLLKIILLWKECSLQLFFFFLTPFLCKYFMCGICYSFQQSELLNLKSQQAAGVYSIKTDRGNLNKGARTPGWLRQLYCWPSVNGFHPTSGQQPEGRGIGPRGGGGSFYS